MSGPRPPADIRRPLGWALLIGGTVALVAALVGTVVVWVVIGDTQRTSRQALEVTDETLVSVDASLAVGADALGAVRGAMGAVVGGVDALGTAVDATDRTLAQLQDVADVLPQSLGSAASAVRSLAGVADTIDRSLTLLGQTPFLPDYAPGTSFGDLVRQLDGAITPLAEGTAGLAADLQGAIGSGSQVKSRLDELESRLGEVDASLARADEQLAGYRATASEAREVAASARRDLDRNLTLLRLVAVPLGLGLAVVQLLPIWFGAALLWPQRWGAGTAGQALPPMAPLRTTSVPDDSSLPTTSAQAMD